MPPNAKKTVARQITQAWYELPTERVASAIYNVVIALEAQQAQRRHKYQALYRMVTGEEPPIYMGLWASRKAATSSTQVAGRNYLRPHDNIMRNAGSVLENRLGTVEPFVQISPKGVSFQVRDACKQVTEFIDGVFDSNRYNGMNRLFFRDMFIYGQTYAKAASIVEDEATKVIVDRIDPYLILVDEVAFRAAFPTDAYELRPYRRSEAVALFARDEDPEIERAIRTAPSLFFSGTGAKADEWILIVEATKLPNAAGEAGRQVITLQNKVISDKPYTRSRYRWAVARWEPPTQNFYVNGGAYILAPFQAEIDGLDQCLRAGIRNNAFTGFLAPDGTGLTAQTMGMRPGFLWKFQGGKPEQIVPVPFPPQLYEYRKQKVIDAYASVGLTQSNVTGSKPQGVTSGKALRLAVDYSDARNKSLIMALEELAAEVAERVLDEAEEVNPVVYTSGIGGNVLQWAKVREAIKRDAYKIKPFPVNAYVGTPGEDAQDAADDYANGLIDRRAFMRLQRLSDLTSYQELATASDDLLEDTLDQIVRTAKFVAPAQTYDDPAAAFKQAQAYFNRQTRLARANPQEEKRNRRVLRALWQFLSVLADRIAHPDGQTLQPPLPAVATGSGVGPAAVMPQDKAAGLPAPPPPQITATSLPVPALGAAPPAAMAA